MYIHIGNDFVVKDDEIIAVFDIENSTISKKTRDFLNIAEKNKNIINISRDIPRSFIICLKNNKTTVYLSQLNTLTILKRTKQRKNKIVYINN